MEHDIEALYDEMDAAGARNDDERLSEIARLIAIIDPTVYQDHE